MKIEKGNHVGEMLVKRFIRAGDDLGIKYGVHIITIRTINALDPNSFKATNTPDIMTGDTYYYGVISLEYEWNNTRFDGIDELKRVLEMKEFA